MKKLSEYLQHINPMILSSKIEGDPLISGLSNNSEKLGAGFIFVAIRGSKNDGHKYIGQAVKSGAEVIVYANEPASFLPGISYIKVKEPYHAYAWLSETFFEFPTRSMKLIGITGTNGKTTTVFILNKLINNALGRSACGLISTVKYVCGTNSVEAARTTPEAYELQSLFSQMRAAGSSHAVMEVSSHALEQDRIGSLAFDCAIFSNLTGDHLDYHKNMENYFAAKKRLFTDHLKPAGTAVINIDDPYGRRLIKELPDRKIISYGTSPDADCRIIPLSAMPDATVFKILFKGQFFEFSSNLIGAHNMSNISAAFCAAMTSDIDPETFAKTVNNGIHVPGRLEKYRLSTGASAFVDYAHTDDALLRVLNALRQLKPNRIITVFGCGGDRDRSKRPRMGKIAAELSDIVIITSDNPRTEDPLSIIREISTGIPADKKVKIQPDRAKAIAYAVSESADGDIILLAGKGHENYQEINGRKEHFDDAEELKKFL